MTKKQQRFVKAAGLEPEAPVSSQILCQRDLIDEIDDLAESANQQLKMLQFVFELEGVGDEPIDPEITDGFAALLGTLAADVTTIKEKANRIFQISKGGAE